MPAGEDVLLAFYNGDGRDVAGRTHSEILAWPDSVLESVHDYIQWLFPLPEPSGANPLAPLITPRVVAAFRSSKTMQNRLYAAWLRMLHFYGLCVETSELSGGTVVRSPSFALRASNWLTPHNHNHLRLTRILRSVHILGLEQQSATLFAALSTIYEEESRSRRRITPETFHYWQRAGH